MFSGSRVAPRQPHVFSFLVLAVFSLFPWPPARRLPVFHVPGAWLILTLAANRYPVCNMFHPLLRVHSRGNFAEVLGGPDERIVSKKKKKEHKPNKPKKTDFLVTSQKNKSTKDTQTQKRRDCATLATGVALASWAQAPSGYLAVPLPRGPRYRQRPGLGPILVYLPVVPYISLCVSAHFTL